MRTAHASSLGKRAVMVAAFAALAACNSEASPSPATPVGLGDPKAPMVTQMTAAAGDAATGDAGPDFYSCGGDTDCVSVPRVGCCYNGALEAVNKSSVDAYRASFTCDNPRPICPQYRRLDRRQPECDDTSKRCTMVGIDSIKCGASHSCPQGFTCQVGDGGVGSCASATP